VGICTIACTTLFPDCCGVNMCVFKGNDPDNCGGCGIKCMGATPYCLSGACQAAPCTPVDGGASCTSGTTCCGTTCCASGQLCCAMNSNLPGGPQPGCYTPTASAPRCPGNLLVP
jgi:hypothetical protein